MIDLLLTLALVAVNVELADPQALPKLEALGFHQTGELRVMVALPGGKRGCVPILTGTADERRLAAMRRVKGVKAVTPAAPRAPGSGHGG